MRAIFDCNCGIIEAVPEVLSTPIRDLTNNTPESAKTPGAHMAESHPTSLYRYYDKNGVLLYVGITGRGQSRNSEHNKTKSWWSRVDRQQVEHFDDRPAALAAEKSAIQTFHPPYNVQHNPDHEYVRTVYEALGNTSLMAVTPLTIKQRGRLLLLERRGGIAADSNTRVSSMYVSSPHDAPIVRHIELGKRGVLNMPASRGGKGATARIWTHESHLMVRLSNPGSRPLPDSISVQFKFASQKPIEFAVQTVWAGKPVVGGPA